MPLKWDFFVCFYTPAPASFSRAASLAALARMRCASLHGCAGVSASSFRRFLRFLVSFVRIISALAPPPSSYSSPGWRNQPKSE
jgi:hypothetical protein